MKKSILLILIVFSFMLPGCNKDLEMNDQTDQEQTDEDENDEDQTDQDSNPPSEQEQTIKFSRNKMIVRFDDSWSTDQINALRGTGSDSEFVLESSAESCNCGDPNIEIWTIDTLATDTSIEAARDRLNRGNRGSKVKGDIDFEITIPNNAPIQQDGGDGPLAVESIDGDVLIAIIDTGLKYTHESPTYEYVLETETIFCDNFLEEWNFVGDAHFPNDEHGHGTYVTKIIRNTLESFNIGFKIIPLKVFDSNGKGSYSNILCALSYLNAFEQRGRNIDVVNASFGGTLSPSQLTGLTLLPELIDELGDDTLFIASAGNEHKDVDNGPLRHFPSGFDSDNILAVGGYKNVGDAIEIHEDSNYGNSSIDLATFYGPYDLEFIGYNTSPVVVSDLNGTSYGTAYVTGIAAKEKGNNMGITDLKGHVINLTDPVNKLTNFIKEGRALVQPPTP